MVSEIYARLYVYQVRRLICCKETRKTFSDLVISLEVISGGTVQLCDRFQNME